MKTKSWTLSAQPAWPACAAPLPLVTSKLTIESRRLCIRWDVCEAEATYRAECLQDGDPCWQDSCVEFFVLAQDGSADYCNFEFNPRGVCLAARGPNRNQRILRTPQEYAQITRQASFPPQEQAGKLFWSLDVAIPMELLGLEPSTSFHPEFLRGNFYKCGDKSAVPHWLSAFPIASPKPDFHRPESFQSLL